MEVVDDDDDDGRRAAFVLKEYEHTVCVCVCCVHYSFDHAERLKPEKSKRV